jgi:hypothetical protein
MTIIPLVECPSLFRGSETLRETSDGFEERAEPQRTFEDAYELLCSTLNSVEDELSGVEYNPENWMTDGRLYPPQQDSFRRDCDGYAEVVRMRTRGHNVFIGPNGAIEIEVVHSSEIIFSKDGADGEGVWG